MQSQESTPEVLRRRKYSALLTTLASTDASQATSSCTAGHSTALGAQGNRARQRGASRSRLGWCVLLVRSADRRFGAGSGGALEVAGASRNAMPTPGRVPNTRKRKHFAAATFGCSFGYQTPTRKYFATRLRLSEVGYRPECDSPEDFRSSLRAGLLLAGPFGLWVLV